MALRYRFKDLRCDFIGCKEMAFFVFKHLKFEDFPEMILVTRDVKLCPTHKHVAIRRGMNEEQAEQIPFAFDSKKRLLKCMRCAGIWKPQSFRDKHMNDPNYLVLPDGCGICRNRAYDHNTYQGDKEERGLLVNV